MKLELANWNKNIKDSLLSLINYKDGDTKDLEGMFAEKIHSEKELKQIIQAMVSESNTERKDIPLTED